ncbi:MAG: hypothetical protein JST87_15135 [Bacteroidetes bacterium]|nr:hypothetical protein [Bacteroidota bacterium]MBS1933760.1 hypothetical protein [Bacteroidota bacterium]
MKSIIEDFVMQIIFLMLTFELPEFGVAMLGVMAVSAFAGFSFRKYKINKAASRTEELEREILQSHSEILQLQKENIDLLKIVDDLKESLVKAENGEHTEISQPVVDISSRKKVFKQEANSSK